MPANRKKTSNRKSAAPSVKRNKRMPGSESRIRISGFTMVKNATKLYYPIAESIASALPLVDEFVVALGDCDKDDKTEKAILSLKSPKVRIIRTKWDIVKYPNGTENAHQTDIAMSKTKGDWLLYLQADEVLHEDDIPKLRQRVEELHKDPSVEGLLFRYNHFWGDYDHVHRSHGWYPYEIRMIRKHPDIHSWESAQSFRRIPDFDGRNYRQQEGTFKLRVAKVDAAVYHYGWVRPPELMRRKTKALDTIHKGESRATALHADKPADYDYGPLGVVARFAGTHPAVMKKRIAEHYWKPRLDYSSEIRPQDRKHKHLRFKYRLLTFIEQKLLGGRHIGEFRNYKLLRR